MEILITVLLAVFFTLVLTFDFKAKSPWKSSWITFLIFFLIMWAANLWIQPIGPIFYGIAWVPLIFIGIIIFLFLTSTQSRDVKRIYTKEISDEKDTSNQTPLNVFFWGLLIVLVLLITLGYLQRYNYL